MKVSLSGSSCNHDKISHWLKETSSLSAPIIKLEISDVEIDVEQASNFVRLLQKHSETITHLSILNCSGHIDIIVTASFTILGLTSLEIGTSVLNVCAHSLGVGLLTSTSLKRLVLHSGKQRYFTLVADTAGSLGQGLIGSESLESLSLKKCRFGDFGAIQSISNALKLNSVLQHVELRECLSANGQSLPNERYRPFLDALKDSQSLISLDLSQNQCHSGIVAEIIKGTSLRNLNLSHQIIEFGDGTGIDLSLMVGALGGSRSLESLDLSFNGIVDGDMPYLVAALSCNTSLQHVDLRGNHISNTGISILASKIPSMRGLKHLILTDNPFDANGTSQLRRSMQLNYSIMHLELDAKLPNHACCMYFPDLNWMRRRFLFQEMVVPALWPHLLERADRLYNKSNGPERRANVVFCMLQKSTALFPL